MMYKRFSFETALEQIAQAGYRHVVLWNRHEDGDILEERGAAARIRGGLERCGLKPAMLFAHTQFKHDQPLEQAIRQIEIAAELGIPEINILTFWGYHEFPNRPITGTEYEALDRKTVAHLRAIAPYAERQGITISIKPHTANSATGQAIHELLGKIGSPSFKACYDPGNIRFYEGADPSEDIRFVLPEICSFVAKDHRGGRFHADFPIPGEGDVDFADLFGQLHAAGFDGPVVIEKVDNVGEKLDLPEIGRRIRQAKRNMERLLAEAGFR